MPTPLGIRHRISSPLAAALVVLTLALTGWAQALLRDAATAAPVLEVRVVPGKPDTAPEPWRSPIPYASISRDVGIEGTAVLQTTAERVLHGPIPESPVDPRPTPAPYRGGAILPAEAEAARSSLSFNLAPAPVPNPRASACGMQ